MSWKCNSDRQWILAVRVVIKILQGQSKMLNCFSLTNIKVLFTQKQKRSLQMMTVLIAFIYMTLFVYQNVYGIPSSPLDRNTIQVNPNINGGSGDHEYA